ncbi:MAG TPA: BTAD domain-containing putative transcriptional regulator [Candidatus Limnocylindrales bacterium]
MIRFQLLGSMAAHGENGPVPLGPARQQTVLAVLLTDLGTPVSFGQLIDRVWGNAPPQRARETLHTYLSRLRSVLAGTHGQPLVRRGHSYVIELDPATVDLHRFRILSAQARDETDDGHAASLWAEALGLWQGAPFAGLDSDWLAARATALETERLAAALEHNDIQLRRGEHARLLPALIAAAGAYPLDERLAGQLMLGLYRCGRQADALAHYLQLRTRLTNELGSDPGQTLQELHHAILRQDPSLAVTGPAEAPTANETKSQIPADIPGFTGREDALRQLDASLEAAGDPPSTVVISTIGGCGGIGKTTLAVHWAHRARDRFPDGQLYLNLRGFDPGGQAMSPGEALRTLLDKLGVPPERLPSTLEGQAGLYRERLAGSRTLVLLDNARSVEQIRPLLPGSPGSMALITSRDDLAGLLATEGARPMWLAALDDDRARQLLARRLGPDRLEAEPEAVDTIVATCAGLPLALAIVAARAATRPGFPLSAFAGELVSGPPLDALSISDPATDVRAVFSWSYKALAQPAARLFRLLGLHPGPDIGLDAAANLARLPIPQTRRLLAELTAAHLLTEHAPGRYAFHDLLRAYANELLHATDIETDRLAALRRMLDHYLHSAHAADRWLPASRDPITLAPPEPGTIVADFDGNTTAREWLNRELPVLLAIVEVAEEAGCDEYLQQLAWTMATFLLWRGQWHLQVTVQDAGLRAASNLGDASGQADIHRRLAYVHKMLGRRDQAHEHSRQALELYRAAGDHTGQARTHLGIMFLFEQEGRHHDALRHAQQCLSSAHLSCHRLVLALAHNAVGWCHTLLGDHEQAISHCEKALPELEELGELATMADVWDTLGHAYHQLGRYPEAIDYYRQAVDRCRELGDHRHEAAHLVRLGGTYEAAGDPDAARQKWRTALKIFEEIQHPDAKGLRERLAASGSVR